MKSIKHWWIGFILKMKARQAARNYFAETRHWRENYDCGVSLYNHLTGGRLAKAEDEFIYARAAYEEHMEINK